MFEIGDKVVYQGADKAAYKRTGVVKAIEDKEGKPQLVVELDGGEEFTAPIDDWSREFSNACKNGCTSTNSVVANAMAANARVARNAWGDEAQVDALITKMVGLIKQIKPIARQLYDTAFELDDAGSVWLDQNKGSKNAQKVKVAVDRANKVMSRLVNFTSGLD